MYSMKISHCALCACFLLLVLNVRGQAVRNYSLSVELLTYRNPTLRVASGRCCEFWCNSECDNTFTFCLRPVNTADSSSCPFGRFQSPVVFSDNINFRTDAEEIGITNFTNITNVDPFLLVITVTDSNFGTRRLVDEFPVKVDVGNGLFSQQMELIGDHDVAEMVLRLNLGCAENFYGPNCNLLCDTSGTICEGSSGTVTVGPFTRAVVGVIITIILLAAISIAVVTVVVLMRRRWGLKLFGTQASTEDRIEAEVSPAGDNPNYTGVASEPTPDPVGGSSSREAPSRQSHHKYEYISHSDRSDRQGVNEGPVNSHRYEYISNSELTHNQEESRKTHSYAAEGLVVQDGNAQEESQKTYSYAAEGSVVQDGNATAPALASAASEIPNHYEVSEEFMRTVVVPHSEASTAAVHSSPE